MRRHPFGMAKTPVWQSKGACNQREKGLEISIPETSLVDTRSVKVYFTTLFISFKVVR